MNTLTELYSELDRLLSEKKRPVLAIDGACASGKTTLADLLAEKYGAAVIRMDHFFLQKHQKTSERLAEAGGNLDRERFCAEVLPPLESGEVFSYRPYDCHREEYAAPVFVPDRGLIVVEGTYALHPAFGRYWDLSAVVFVPSLVQVERILTRPQALVPRFLHEWIPMEEQYFSAFSIFEGCDLVLDGTALSSDGEEGK